MKMLPEQQESVLNLSQVCFLVLLTAVAVVVAVAAVVVVVQDHFEAQPSILTFCLQNFF